MLRLSRTRTLATVWLACFLLSTTGSFARAEEDGQVEDEDDVVETAEAQKPKFVPAPFVAPSISDEPTPYLYDYFPSDSRVGQKWLKSKAKKDGIDAEIAKYNGEWDIGPPMKVAIDGDYGLVVRNRARHHAIAAKLQSPFKFDQETLVVQYDVKFEEGQECGGGYLKLLSSGAEKDLEGFQDKTPYTIMFGPDKCGATGKIHLIFKYKNPKNGSIDEYHAKQPTNLGTTYWDDHRTHLYTLVVKPSGDFSVSVDSKSIFSGNILSDVVPSLTPPKQIADPSDKKPDNWDDRPEIEDETAVKPDDWDENQPKEVVDDAATKPSDWLESEPELIPDPDAVKPADWDTDMDGEWEPPSIDNPACKGVSGCGVWKPKTIPNPKYKGKWVRPKITNPEYKGVWSAKPIDNPDFFEPTPFGGLAPIAAVGIEMWTMNENIVFDDVIVTSSEEQAQELAKQTFAVKQVEEARLGASQGEGGGFMQKVIDAANDRPWLWVVYVLAVVIPLVFIGVFCFGRKSSARPEDGHKKTDAYSADDAFTAVDPDGEGEEVQDDDDEEPEPAQPSTSKSNSKADVTSATSSKRDVSAPSSEDQDDDEEEAEEEQNDDDDEGIEAEPTEEVVAAGSQKPSSGVKRRTARRE